MRQRPASPCVDLRRLAQNTGVRVNQALSRCDLAATFRRLLPSFGARVSADPSAEPESRYKPSERPHSRGAPIPVHDKEGSRPRRAARADGDRARYGGPWFEAAISLRLTGGLGRPRRLLQLLAAAARRPGRFAALIRLLLHTPSEVVILSPSAAGRALQTYFSERFLGVFPQNRLCRGVLLLPDDHSNYRRGKRRQALRTNLRKAQEAGISCGPIEDPDIGLAAVGEVLANRTNTFGDRDTLVNAWRPHFWRTETTVLAARDRDGHPLAMAMVVIDSEICLIQFAVASHHEARWAVHDHLVGVLIEQRVKYLFAEGGGPFGALGFEADLHHYQHLLGYQLRHLLPRLPAPLLPQPARFSRLRDVPAPARHPASRSQFARYTPWSQAGQ